MDAGSNSGNKREGQNEIVRLCLSTCREMRAFAL